MANIVVAFVLWVVGGIFGLHHFYLRRDKQAFVWWCSLGGVFLLGWFRDLFKLPEYVAAANNDIGYLREFEVRRNYHPRPPFSVSRFGGELAIGCLFAYLLRLAVPEEIIEHHKLLAVVLPTLGTTFGVYLVANIGREKASVKWPFIGALCGIPFILQDQQAMTAGVLFSAIAVNWRGKEWRVDIHKPQGCCNFLKRIIVLTFCGLLYLSLWTSCIYFNASVTTKDGETVPVREAVHNFFKSPAWAETKETLSNLYNFYQAHGWQKIWEQIVEALDPTGEANAYKVLGLKHTASPEDIKTKCRKLSRQYHPDKHKNSEKEAAQEKFIEIQQACDILNTIRAKRAQKNQRFKGHHSYKDEF